MDEEIERLRRQVRTSPDPFSIARLASTLNRAGQAAICELDGHYVIYNIEVFGTTRNVCWLKDSDPRQTPLPPNAQAEAIQQIPRIRPNAPHELPPLPILLSSIDTALKLRNDPEMSLTAQQFLAFLLEHIQRASLFNTSSRFVLGTTDTITHGNMLGLRQHAPALRLPETECMWPGLDAHPSECDTLCYALTGLLPEQIRTIISQFDNTPRTDFQILLPNRESPSEGALLLSLTHAFGDSIFNIHFQSLPEKQIKGGSTIPVTYL